MKKLLILACLAIVASAVQIEVTADKFRANEKNQTSEFEGNVTIKKESDTLRAEYVLISFNNEKEPTLYTATGDVKINMLFESKHYSASADKITYEPVGEKYTLLGKAFLAELDTDKKVYGEKIEIDQRNGNYSVDGDSDSVPARFVFQVEDTE